MCKISQERNTKEKHKQVGTSTESSCEEDGYDPEPESDSDEKKEDSGSSD